MWPGQAGSLLKAGYMDVASHATMPAAQATYSVSGWYGYCTTPMYVEPDTEYWVWLHRSMAGQPWNEAANPVAQYTGLGTMVYY